MANRIGSQGRAYINIESTTGDSLKVAVMTSDDVLVGYAVLGGENGGYLFRNIENWSGRDNKVSIKGTVMRLLSVSRFHKELSA